MNPNLKYWLALNQIENLGPVTIKKLWENFGSAKTVWEASESALLAVEDVKRPAIRALLNQREGLDLDREYDRVVKHDLKVLTLEDNDYPALLKNIYDPPPVLYIKGTLLKSDEKALAIVGTRKASHYGLEIARKLSLELSALGITIVSGMALGIDTEAHKAALEAKGRTLAIFGCGIDMIYPPENIQLAKEIPNAGALISEFPIGSGTSKGTFPRRNRIISGLSLGVIVVEGHYDSGAMITAKDALEQGREVFAVPGNVEMEQSKGPHWLIKQGAKLVESVDDILEELQNVISVRPVGSVSSIVKPDLSGLTDDEKRVISLLTREPRHIDEISRLSGLDIAKIASPLLSLELKRLIKPLPGKYFILV